MCVEKGYDYVVSPYESDAQLTFLQKIGLIDYILTEDSDHLLFGCREFTKVIFKVNFDTMDGELIVLNDVFGSTISDKLYSFTDNMFRCMCILSGCDYLYSLKGVGIKRAYAAVRQKPDPNDAITFLKNKHHLTVPDYYQCSFQLAMSTILSHQYLTLPNSHKFLFMKWKATKFMPHLFTWMAFNCSTLPKGTLILEI